MILAVCLFWPILIGVGWICGYGLGHQAGRRNFATSVQSHCAQYGVSVEYAFEYERAITDGRTPEPLW